MSARHPNDADAFLDAIDAAMDRILALPVGTDVRLAMAVRFALTVFDSSPTRPNLDKLVAAIADAERRGD